MTNYKNYEKLESLPTYGPIHISVTENNENYFSAGFPIRFFKNDKTNWVANFKPGWTELNEIFEIVNQSNLIVIAGGMFYLMNPENEKPIKAFGGGFERYLKSKNGKIILQDQTDLTVIEPNGEHWSSERISWDGIKNLKLIGNLISGLSYDPMNEENEWVEFELNIENRKVEGGSYRNYEYKKSETKWWKFW